jgi:hypothetical protein
LSPRFLSSAEPNARIKECRRIALLILTFQTTIDKYIKEAFLGFLLLGSMAACTNSSDKNKGGSDSTASVKKTAKARNSDVDTNVMKIGTEPMEGEAGSSTGKEF